LVFTAVNVGCLPKPILGLAHFFEILTAQTFMAVSLTLLPAGKFRRENGRRRIVGSLDTELPFWGCH
jgi:hypothetical protein